MKMELLINDKTDVLLKRKSVNRRALMLLTRGDKTNT